MSEGYIQSLDGTVDTINFCSKQQVVGSPGWVTCSPGWWLSHCGALHQSAIRGCLQAHTPVIAWLDGQGHTAMKTLCIDFLSAVFVWKSGLGEVMWQA